MTSTPLDARSRVLDAATGAVATRAAADVALLVAAADWCLLHPATEATGYAGFGEDLLFGEALLPLAGEGAPLVAEFAPAELAAVLGWSTLTAQQLMADALELRSRLPRLWTDLLAGRVPVALARYVAEQTHDLDREAVDDADRMLAGDPDHLTRRSVKRLVDEIRLYHDPDRAVAEEQQALAARKVELRPGTTPATSELIMSLDTADAEAFNKTIADVADALHRLGDHDEVDVRRARAVGVLADPQAALDLLTTGQTDTQKRRSGGQLFLHLDLATLADLAVSGMTGGVHDERHGVATTDLITTWLTGWLGPDTPLVVKPVLDLHDPDPLGAVDGHDPTDPIADHVRLRDPVCVFPGCARPSRHCDLDHIKPYQAPDDGGPPGQTHPENLAPLCRHHHRVKTHGRWTYQRLPDGSYQWTSPSGRTIEVLPARPRGPGPRPG